MCRSKWNYTELPFSYLNLVYDVNSPRIYRVFFGQSMFSAFFIYSFWFWFWIFQLCIDRLNSLNFNSMESILKCVINRSIFRCRSYSLLRIKCEMSFWRTHSNATAHARYIAQAKDYGLTQQKKKKKNTFGRNSKYWVCNWEKWSLCQV